MRGRLIKIQFNNNNEKDNEKFQCLKYAYQFKNMYLFIKSD